MKYSYRYFLAPSTGLRFLFKCVITCHALTCFYMTSAGEALAASDPEFSQSDLQKQVFVGLVQDQVANMNKEDLDAYMGRLHPSSPIYEHYRITMGQLFTVYDLATHIKKVDVLSVETDYVVLRVRMTKRKTGGRARFRDVYVDALWVYRRQGDHWLLWLTSSLHSKPLTSKVGV